MAKNKVAPPFKVAEFDILYGHGISKEGELIDMGVALEIVEKSGSWFSYNGERIGQGKDKAKQYLEANPAVAEEIKNRIFAQKDKLAGGAVKVEEDDLQESDSELDLDDLDL